MSFSPLQTVASWIAMATLSLPVLANSAPTASGTPTLTAVSDNTTSPAGDTVANLFGTSYTDADGDTLAGIAITANAATAEQGVWQYSTDSGSNWNAIATTGLADATALYLTSTAKLRFLPADNFNGTPGQLTMRLVDTKLRGTAAASSADIQFQFYETAAGVSGSVNLDPDDFTGTGWTGTFKSSTSTGPEFIGIGGNAGFFTNDPVGATTISVSNLDQSFTGASSTAPNFKYSFYSAGDSATGDYFGLAVVSPTESAFSYDQAMYNALAATGSTITSTIEWDGATLAELGIISGQGTITSTSASCPLTFNGDYSVIATPAPASGGTVDASNNGGTTAISAATLSLSTSVTDNTAPTLTASTPADDATGVAVDADIVLTFSETVVAGTGNIIIKKSADDSTVATIDVSDAEVSISGDTVTINPSAGLDGSTGYYIQIDDGALQDAAGNNYTGLNGSTTLNFTTKKPDVYLATALSTPDTNCSAGGVKLEVGPDYNESGVLDTDEVDASRTQYICNGTNGTNGADGYNTLVVTDADVGTECDTYGNGGIRVRSGLDNGDGTGTENDGTLQDDEVDATTYVCNGADGAQGDTGDTGDAGADGYSTLMVTDTEVGAECDSSGNGGTRVRSGLDNGDNDGTAGDEILQDGEVDATTYICNGADGTNGTGGTNGTDGTNGTNSLTSITQLAAGSDECPAGGVLVQSGPDTNGDGILAADEVDESAAVCSGVDGLIDEDKDGIDDRIDVTGGANCAASGAPFSLWGLLAVVGLGLRRRRR